MYAAIRRYERVEPDAIPKIRQLVEDEFLPKLGGEGFRGYYLIDEGDGNAITISIFDSRERAEESTRLAAELVRDKMSELISSPPTVMTGEVTSSKVMEGAGVS